jgi:mannose-6-phosphate isomerase-like protein (cupin superfamily)
MRRDALGGGIPGDTGHARMLARPSQGICVDVDGDHAAFARQALDDRPADPAATAGHDVGPRHGRKHRTHALTAGRPRRPTRHGVRRSRRRRERESRQEEIYVAVAGSGHVVVDGERVRLKPGVFVLVEPESTRQIVAGPEGLAYVIVGAEVPDANG